jgi:hypothetical protein
VSALLEDVRHLAGTIGPRGTGTSARTVAAAYVGGRPEGLELAPERHAFRSVRSQNLFPIAISLVALAGTAVYRLAILRELDGGS